MSEEQTPDVEEIKNRLSDEAEIPVEEEETVQKAAPDLSEEFRKLGQQFGETLRTAWNSEERQRFESEMRKGMTTFANEIDKAFAEVKQTRTAQKVQEEASELREKVESGQVGQKTRGGLAQGLHWLSEELSKLADQFTPAGEGAPEEEPEIEIKLGDEEKA